MAQLQINGRTYEVVILGDKDTGAPINPGGGAGGGGDASAANQLAGNTSLANIDADIGALDAAAAPVDGTGNYSLIAAAKRQLLNWAAVLGIRPAAQSLSVAAASDSAFLGRVLSPTTSFARPANTTAYASGQLLANSVTAGSVTPMSLAVAHAAGGSFMLRRVKLAKSTAGVTNASFRLHLWSASPTVANGDGGTFNPNGVASYIGAFDVTMDRAFSDGACGFGVPVVGSDMTVKLASGTAIFGLIEARAAYAPGSSETFTVTLDDIVAL